MEGTRSFDAHVGIVVLIDSDPPSGHGDIGLYPPTTEPMGIDPIVFWQRHAGIRDFLSLITPSTAVVTVHTSQRHRFDLIEGQFVDAWHELTSLGADLALHPHEERHDSTSMYGDIRHMSTTIARVVEAASREGLTFSAFRSGFFAFSDTLPDILANHGIEVDLSAAAGLKVPQRGVDWPSDIHNSYRFEQQPNVLEIPLGWSGRGTNLGTDYLFNERQTLAGLKSVYEAIRGRAEQRGTPQLVNLLCHGYGLAQSGFLSQVIGFLEYVRSNEGVVIDIESALEFHDTRVAATPTSRPRGEIRGA